MNKGKSGNHLEKVGSLMSEIASGMACPQCDAIKQTAMIFARVGSSEYFCKNGHKYNDLGHLKALNPRTIPVPQKIIIQQGHEKVEMMIPTELKVLLLQKFGSSERLAATLSGVFRAIATSGCFVVASEDADQIEKITGTKVRTSQELVGILFSKNEDVKQARQEAANAKQNGAPNGATSSSAPGDLVINIGSHLQKLNAVARFRGAKPETVCEETMKTALDNNWA